MALTLKQVRGVNPPKKKKRRRRNAPNPSELVLLGGVNPKKRKKKRRRRHNPRRQPLARGVDMLKVGAVALGGLFVTRQVPQLALGTRNTGLLGYIANGVTAGLGSTAVSRFVGKQEGQAFLIGGALYVVERIVNEQFTPLGRALSLSGVGDHMAAGTLAGIKENYCPMPALTDAAGRPIIPKAILEAARAQARAELRAAAAPAIVTPTNSGAAVNLGRYSSRY